MQVQGILARKGDRVATIDAGATLAGALAQLRDEGVGALVVAPTGDCVEGIVSERDLVRRLAEAGADALGEPVRDVMTSPVVTCAPDDDVAHLMRLMTDRRVRHLPVVDGGGRLVGIVSIGDLVKVRLAELEVENRSLVGYLSNTP